MEILKWILMIAGIFGLLIIGCLMLLKSAEKKHQATIVYNQNMESLEQTNEMLDQTIEQLETLNEPLKKASDSINKFNQKYLNK